VRRDGPEGKSLADVSSDSFELQTDSSYIQVNSDVEVMQSSALVRKDLRVAKSKRARKCFTQALRKELGSQGTDVASLSVALMKPGVPGGLGYRIKVMVRGNGVTVPVYGDVEVVCHRIAGGHRGRAGRRRKPGATGRRKH
jgi:hypothetical protein